MTTVNSRVYLGGIVVGEDLDHEALEGYIRNPNAVVWIDFVAPARSDLDWVAQVLNLHPIAVNEALELRTRPKLDRYDTHLFLSSYYLGMSATSGQLIDHEIACFVTKNTLVTVRLRDSDVLQIIERRAGDHSSTQSFGVYALVWALLDVVVDSHFESIQRMDERLDELEDDVFSATPRDRPIQHDMFRVRKDLLRLRRITLPMREIVNALLRNESTDLPQALMPYFDDVYDHTLRVNEWVDSLRDLVTSLLDANLTIQGNRMNLVMKKVTSWAAIIAVPTLITGFFGQNVQFFGFGSVWGLVLSCASIIGASTILYILFKRNDWL